MFKWNIRNQILSTGILSFLVLIIAVISFYRFSASQFSDNMKSLLLLSGRQSASEISEIFNNQSADFSGWIQDDIYGLAIEFETTKEVRDSFVKKIAHSQRFDILTLIDTTGKILEIAGAKNLPKDISRWQGKILPDFISLKKIKSDTCVFLSSIFLSQLDLQSKATYVYYHPAYALNGQRIGAFIAYADWYIVKRSAEQHSQGLNAINLEKTHLILAFPPPQQWSFCATKEEIGLHKEQLQQLISLSTNQHANSVLETTIDDTEMLLGISNINPPHISNSIMARAPVLLMAIDKSTIMKTLDRQVIQIILLSLLATLIVLGVNYFAAQKISVRLSHLATIAEEIAMGNVNQNIATNTNDEIGHLAGSFQKLIDYIKYLAKAAEEIAHNDLTVKIEPRSENDILGNSFKLMVSNLTEIVGLIAKNAAQLVVAATEISLSSQQIAKGSAEQTEKAAQVSTAIEQMAATITQSSQNAVEAKDISQNATKTANQGQKVVGDTINGMLKISDSAANSELIVSELAKASDRIGDIIKVIDDISDQTNLLALNAAIEAARAGEKGRGFAVVADEVRKLAERTGKATKEVTDMIQGIQNGSTRAVASINEAGELVEEGKVLADKAGNSLYEINAMSSQVMEMIAQIANAAEEQSIAAEEISRNMEEIAEVSQQTAMGAKQSATAAEELNQQADSLQEIVDKFKLVK